MIPSQTIARLGQVAGLVDSEGAVHTSMITATASMTMEKAPVNRRSAHDESLVRMHTRRCPKPRNRSLRDEHLHDLHDAIS
jgi:hypothetical protein